MTMEDTLEQLSPEQQVGFKLVLARDNVRERLHAGSVTEEDLTAYESLLEEAHLGRTALQPVSTIAETAEVLHVQLVCIVGSTGFPERTDLARHINDYMQRDSDMTLANAAKYTMRDVIQLHMVAV
jgi:hypothetical protein